jgi:predicted HicB family RNase H-like nuclease
MFVSRSTTGGYIMGTRKKAQHEGEKAITIKTTLRVPRPLWTNARIRALEEGVPVQELVVRAIRDYVGKGGRS